MKKFTIPLIAALLVLNTSVSAQRGTIVQAIPITSLTPQQIMQGLQLDLDELSFTLVDYFTYKKNAVNAVKIIYNTIDGKGNPTVASGAVFLPILQNETEVPVFSYLHGTLTRDLDVPSNLMGIESITGWIMGMDGYIAVLPDYLGMGDGPGIHPYTHAESEASASIDMLIAATLLCTNPQIYAKPNGDLYLSGYSQGAHAALATQRELQKNPLPNLTLRKTVVGSGAYSLSYIQKKFLFDNPDYPNPSFMPYLLLGYQDVYENLYTDLNQVFVPPYHTTIPELFNGLLDVEEIDLQLPSSWKSMFVPRYLRNIQYRYFHPVNIDLRKNDLINWKPENDLHLYYCTCDELVAKENSMLAYLSFLLKGSRNVTCLPIGNFNHADCAPFVMLLSKIQFDCASGANPCGFNVPSLTSQNRLTSESNLAMLADAMKGEETLDPASIYENRQIAAYFSKELEDTRLLSMYPNPTHGQVFVELPKDLPDNSKLCVYNVQGKLMHVENISGEIIQLNVKALQQGLYNVVLTGEMIYSETLLVTH